MSGGAEEGPGEMSPIAEVSTTCVEPGGLKELARAGVGSGSFWNGALVGSVCTIRSDEGGVAEFESPEKVAFGFERPNPMYREECQFDDPGVKVRGSLDLNSES